MGKKRAREADGQTEPSGASIDKMDEDGSSDDEVNLTSLGPLGLFLSLIRAFIGF